MAIVVLGCGADFVFVWLVLPEEHQEVGERISRDQRQ